MLISFEGLPGSGKTTQAGLLADRLRTEGYRVAYLPDLATLNNDAAGQQLVELFTSSDDPFFRHGDVLTDTFLAAAVRTHIVATHLNPATASHSDGRTAGLPRPRRHRLRPTGPPRPHHDSHRRRPPGSWRAARTGLRPAPQPTTHTVAAIEQPVPRPSATAIRTRNLPCHTTPQYQSTCSTSSV